MLFVELVTCDVFLESKEKAWYIESIVKEASKKSGLVTGHLRETLFSHVNADTIRVAKALQMNSTILIFSSHALDFKPKKPPHGVKIL